MNIRSLFFGLLLMLSFQLKAQSLIEMIKTGNWDQVRKIANSGNVDQTDENQATPLMWAVYKANLDIVQLLVKQGANLYAQALSVWVIRVAITETLPA